MWDDAGDALRAVESLHGVPDDWAFDEWAFDEWAFDDWGFDEGGVPEGGVPEGVAPGGVASDDGDGREGGDRGPELTASGGSRE